MVQAGSHDVGSDPIRVDAPTFIHRANVRSHSFCGTWWTNTEREIARIQEKTTIVHNPHAYFFLLPNPIQLD